MIVGAVCWPGAGCENIGEIDTSEVWMSAGATPSDLMSETSALAAFAFAAIASPAVFPVFVTPSVTRAKSGAALTLPSPVTSISGGGEKKKKKKSRGRRGGGEGGQECD